MNVTFYPGFKKRRNSTKQPDGSGGSASFPVRLKENTSMMRPVFMVSTVNWHWNYASWDGRFYYVTDIVSSANEYFEVHCELDVLATFKTDIGNYTTLISRSDAAYNAHVMDTIYPAMSDPYTLSASASTAGLFTTSRDSGAIIMGVMGHGGLQFVVMSVPAFTQLCSVLFPVITQSPAVYFAATISEALVGGLNTVMQSIVLLKWLPVDWSVAVAQLGLTAAQELYIGQIKWDLQGQANVYKLSGNTIVTVGGRAITFPDRQSGGVTQQGDWLYMQPFASYSLSAPPFGLITIDGSFLVPSGRQLQAIVRVEILSGNAQLILNYNDSGLKPCGKYNACVSYDIKAGGATSNPIGGLAGAASAAIAIATKDYAGAAGAIMSAANSMIPQPGHMGAGVSGPVPDLADTWYAKATYYDPIEENRAELGRPLGEIRQISTLSGFVQTADAKLAIAGHAEEMVEVNNLLNIGIFYE